MVVNNRVKKFPFKSEYKTGGIRPDVKCAQVKMNTARSRRNYISKESKNRDEKGLKR